MRLQKLCIVQISAFMSKSCCRLSAVLSGSFMRSSSIADDILPLISSAAAFVNVTIRSLSASTGASLSVISFITLSTSTLVFPEPAAADTIIEPPLASIASCCDGVNFIPLISFPPPHCFRLPYIP